MIGKKGDKITLTTPVTDQDVALLNAGDEVLISGKVYTARDAAHKRLNELIAAGKPLPVDLKGAIVYYVGPTPPKPGQIIGSAGPTTASRMDSTTEPLLKAGMKGTIGKGWRGEECAKLFPKYRAIHFAAIGGAGAYLSKCIKSARVLAFEDLGPEAIYELEFVDFPVLTINDVHGRDFYDEARKQWQKVDLDRTYKIKTPSGGGAQ